MNEYRSRGITVTRMLHLRGIPESTYYRKHSMIHLKRGRKPSQTTCLSVGNDIVRIPDTQILLVIEELLGREFVCYGYKKVTKYLQKSGYIINRKKVFRIMKENNLLNHTYNHRSPARRVVDPVVTVNAPDEIWEMDIKYIYIQGENRKVIRVEKGLYFIDTRRGIDLYEIASQIVFPSYIKGINKGFFQ